MPTQHNSPIYEGDWPQLDAASIIVLRNAGALILGSFRTPLMIIIPTEHMLTKLIYRQNDYNRIRGYQ